MSLWIFIRTVNRLAMDRVIENSPVYKMVRRSSRPLKIYFFMAEVVQKISGLENIFYIIALAVLHRNH